tara:strand:+ start:145 stop:465 length:321 start_codon:yes stop_codon:yes gene_type:complete
VSTVEVSIRMSDLREIARGLLKIRRIPLEYEAFVYESDIPYEYSIRRLLQGEPLQKVLGKVEVADSVVQCRCGSRKVLERSVQTRSADEGATSFYHCTTCNRNWKS